MKWANQIFFDSKCSTEIVQLDDPDNSPQPSVFKSVDIAVVDGDEIYKKNVDEASPSEVVSLAH